MKMLLKVTSLGVSTPYSASRIDVSPQLNTYFQIDLEVNQIEKYTDDDGQQLFVLNSNGIRATLRGLLGAITLDEDF